MPQTMYNLYCGLKPVTALAFIAELERQGVGLEAGVGDLLGLPVDPLVTVGDLLCHNAGLSQPRIIDCFLRTDEPVDELLQPESIASNAVHDVATYSETAAWTLVGRICGRLSNHSIDEIFRAHVGRLSHALALIVPDEADSRIGCYYDMKWDPPLPLLHDRLRRFRQPTIVSAITGYAAMSALARWYDLVLRCRDGASVPGFPCPELTRKCTVPQRVTSMDEVLGRPCSFGFGFMTNVREHGFGSCVSPSSFGQAGFLGNSFAFADPERELVVAYVTSGLAATRSITAEVARPALVSAIYDALGLL